MGAAVGVGVGIGVVGAVGFGAGVAEGRGKTCCVGVGSGVGSLLSPAQPISSAHISTGNSVFSFIIYPSQDFLCQGF